MSEEKKYEIYGHRGARGYFPENTLVGFIEAVKIGIHWLELDVVISKDKKVVVSHEPWMSTKLCTLPDGCPVTSRKYNLYKMNYEEIKKFDCGKRTDKNFLKQKSIPSYKPLLNEMIDEVDAYTSEHDLPQIKYCIEIKSFKITERKYQPPAKEFAELVYQVIKEKKIENRVLVQSFDRRILRHFQKLDSTVKTGLIFINLFSVKTNIKKLGFVPYSYNPYHNFITKRMIDKAHEIGMKVIAWTVNDEKRMKQLIKNDVNGIVTDYPDIALRTCSRISADCSYLAEKT